MRTIPSPHYERPVLLASALAKREAELSLYRTLPERELRQHLLRAETAIKEAARKRRHLKLVPSDAGRCLGGSCDQGRQTCREHCNQLKEMSVYAPDDDNEARAKSEWDAIVIVGAFALVAVLLAGAVMWLSYTYADPILAVLGRVLN